MYKSSHEWLRIDGDVATVGITHHAQGALGEIVFADLPDVGRDVAAAEATAAVESVKAAADIYSPVAGEVVAVNENLENSPDLINKKPHDDGWMFKVKMTDPTAVDGVMDADAYTKSLVKDE
jgi:glycine cleavage system H protein